MIKYKGVYVLKLSNWAFLDIHTHQVEPSQPQGTPPGAPDWQVGCWLACTPRLLIGLQTSLLIGLHSRLLIVLHTWLLIGLHTTLLVGIRGTRTSETRTLWWPSSLPRLRTRREHNISELRVKVVFPSRTQILKKTCISQSQKISPRLKATI